MSFAQLKKAIKSRFMDDSKAIKDEPPPNKTIRSSATCPNFSFGDAPSLASSSTSSTCTATPKTSTASAGDWGRREHYLKLAFLSDSNSY